MQNSTKCNSQSSYFLTRPEKDTYMPNPSLNEQFDINIKSNNKSNDAIAIIKGLFLNIRYKSLYERLMEKTV